MQVARWFWQSQSTLKWIDVNRNAFDVCSDAKLIKILVNLFMLAGDTEVDGFIY